MAVTYKFNADGSGYARGLEKMRGQTKKFSSSVAKMLGGAFTVGAFVVGIKKVATEMTDVLRLSERLGVSVQSFQRLSFAAKQVGVDAEGMADAMKDLNVKISDAAMNGGSFAEMFEQVGFDMKELKNASPEKQFLAFADAVKEAGGNLSRFGADEINDQMFQLVPLLMQGAEGIRAMGDEAVVFSEEQAKAVDAARKLVEKTTEQINGMFSIMLANGITTAKGLAAGFGQAIVELRKWMSTSESAEGAATRIGLAFATASGALDGGDDSAAKAAELENQAKLLEEQDKINKERESRASRILKIEQAIALERSRGEEVGLETSEKLEESKKRILSLETKKAAIEAISFGRKTEAGAKVDLEIEKEKTKQKGLQNKLAEDAKASEKKIAEEIASKEAEISAEKDARSEIGMSDMDLADKLLKEESQIESEIAAMKKKAMEDGEIDPEEKKGLLDKELELQKKRTELAGAAEGLTGGDLGSQQVITSALASIGGGGGTATTGDPMLSESKRQTDLLATIAQQLGATEEGGTTNNPEL